MVDSFDLFRRGQRALAGAVAVDAQHPGRFILGTYPTHVARGAGAYLWDHRGNKYLDFMGGGGTTVLGYANVQVDASVSEALHRGASLSLPTHHEVEAAEKLKELFPFVDCFKFFTSERAACDYVGGILTLQQKTWVAPSTLTHQELQARRDAETAAGNLLVYDEVASGLRYPKFSVAGYTGIHPDLIVLGGALGAGFPLAAVGGSYAVMAKASRSDDQFSGHALPLVAAKTAARLLQTSYSLDHLWEHGVKFLRDFNAVCPEKVRLEGGPAGARFFGDRAFIQSFWRQACQAGMLFGNPWHLTFPLGEEYRYAMGAILTILGKIKHAGGDA